MVSVTRLRVVGNNIVASRSNGTTQIFTSTANGFYIPATNPGVSTGGGGGEENDTPATGGTPGTSAAPVDDYPWPSAPQDDYSPLGYSYRDCTDFAAWRVNRDLGTTSAPWMYGRAQLRIVNGNAIGWKDDWNTHGWGVSSSPTAGMLGWFGTKAGSQGHVNYVQKVNTDGSIHMEEYNWLPHAQAYNQRDAAPGDAYFPDAFLAMPPTR